MWSQIKTTLDANCFEKAAAISSGTLIDRWKEQINIKQGQVKGHKQEVWPLCINTTKDPRQALFLASEKQAQQECTQYSGKR